MLTARYYDAVLFDLLTALLDSWTLWNEIAGSEERGHRWRAEYLRRSYETGEYRPYQALVAESAALDARFAQLQPCRMCSRR